MKMLLYNRSFLYYRNGNLVVRTQDQGVKLQRPQNLNETCVHSIHSYYICIHKENLPEQVLIYVTHSVEILI
jgi:hypothetical protein